MGMVKFILGVSLALLLMSFIGVAATRYFMARLAAQPPRPTFPNDTVETLGEIGEPEPPAAEAEDLPAFGTDSASPPSNPAAPAASPAAETAAPQEATSPAPEGYPAQVTQPIGLIIRAEPDRDAEHVGGIEYQQKLTIVGESADGEWLQIRLDNGQSGWVKSGNTERLDPEPAN